MPRTKRQFNPEDYTTLATIHWKEYLNEKKMLETLKNHTPNRQMLLPGGYTHQRITEPKDGNLGTIQNVVFDAEYVNYYMHYRILEPIGWFTSGKVDRLGFEAFLSKQYEYSEQIPRQAYLEGIKEKAKELAISFPHKSFEEWEKELLGSSDHVSINANGAPKSSKSKATV